MIKKHWLVAKQSSNLWAVCLPQMSSVKPLALNTSRERKQREHNRLF